MTNKEAIKYLIAPTATSTEPGAEYLKQKEAYDLAIKALEEVEEWHKLKLICANEGIVVYKVRENDNEKV